MIGNDVIDLNIATQQSNWQRPNYLDKVFTSLEQGFISKAGNPDEMVWSLWSRKEAVYKIIRQKGGKVGYYPKKIECLDSSSILGKVSYEGTIYFTQTNSEATEIHTIAVTKTKDFQFIKKLEKYDYIIKINDIPFLIIEDKRYTASKSHHGRFEKVVCLID